MDGGKGRSLRGMAVLGIALAILAGAATSAMAAGAGGHVPPLGAEVAGSNPAPNAILGAGATAPDHYRFIGGKVREQGSSRGLDPVSAPTGGRDLAFGLIGLVAAIAVSVAVAAWTASGRYRRLPARSAG